MSQRTRNTLLHRARALLVLVALLLALGGVLSTAAQRPNGAGLVIRHGDGTLIYAYVQFDEDSISGLELLNRSGVDVTLAPFGGLGGAVCSLNGEGCPSDNCFCHSFSSPAYYWHYYVNDGGGWLVYPVGPSSRTVTDGDIDGWSWTSGDSGLPSTDIDNVATITGFDRSPAEPTATPEPTPATPEPTATMTSLPADTSTPMPTLTATIEPATSHTTQPLVALTETATPVPTVTATPTRGPDSTPATVPSTATAAPTAAAVIVTPGATPVPLVAGESSGDNGTPGYVLFLGMASVVVAIGAVVVLRNRSRSA
jgi:hypothetical protein